MRGQPRANRSREFLVVLVLRRTASEQVVVGYDRLVQVSKPVRFQVGANGGRAGNACRRRQLSISLNSKNTEIVHRHTFRLINTDEPEHTVAKRFYVGGKGLVRFDLFFFFFFLLLILTVFAAESARHRRS